MSTSKNTGINITPEKEAKLNGIFQRDLAKQIVQTWVPEILELISDHIEQPAGIGCGYGISALGEEAAEEFLTKELTSIFEAIDDIPIRTD